MNIDILLASLPAELIHHLVTEFQQLHERYYLKQWDSSQLNGGRFGEIVLRILEYKNTGVYSPIGRQLAREQIINSIAQNTSLSVDLRLTIPRLAAVVMDFRNTRNVAHVGTITVNAMDSSLVLHISNWIMAEFVRIEANLSPEESQKAILKIIDRKIPLIEEIGNRLKVLDPKMSIKNRVLIFAYQKYPTRLSESDLFEWSGDTNKSRFHSYLLDLNKQNLIDLYEGMVTLTKRGILYIEKNINFELVI